MPCFNSTSLQICTLCFHLVGSQELLPGYQILVLMHSFSLLNFLLFLLPIDSHRLHKLVSLLFNKLGFGDLSGHLPVVMRL
uniref:Callose synthase 3 n=1 Tax=Rhizophora mucronata TaxID=61149 RepID=A0A2P2JAE3_RHIMU